MDLAQPAIDCAVAWGEENDLSFSTRKTAVVLFTRKRNLKLRQETPDEWRRTRVHERSQVPRDQTKPQPELAGTYPG